MRVYSTSNIPACKPGTSLRERLERRIDKSAGPDGCWPWIGARNELGYGIACVGKSRMRRAHRAVYEALIGPLSSDTVLLHSCDNPCCVNPAHLRPGTHADNMRDMREKGRDVPIARTPTRLSADDVREIRADSAPHRKIAERFGITHGYVANIKARRSRTDVP